MIEYPPLTDVKLSCENECEGLLSLLPDCRVGVKVRVKTIPAECIGITHDNLLSQLWSDVRVDKAGYSRTAGCTLTSGTRLARPLILGIA